MSATEIPIRPAATVMLLRDTSDGLEVFMLRRTNAAVFAGGMYVFPGGRVDPADGEGDEAFVVAAIRECYEECGVLLAVDAAGRMVDDGHPSLAHRDRVYDGSVDVRELVESHGLRLATDALAWTAHWVTPRGEPRRFDTRIFVAATPAGQTAEHDDNETVESMWVLPRDGVSRYERKEMGLMPPTIASLRWLSEFPDVASVMDAARLIGIPPRIQPRARLVDGRMVALLLPGDPGYDELED
jgi:8-oxo-dGTP pyrophosphatase MutT (NUDIX family)